MAITQTDVTNYTGIKPTYETYVSNIATDIAVGDTIAYHNKKDGMFYFLKVTGKNILDGDVALTVYGTRFSTTNTSVTMSAFLGIPGVSICQNAKDSSWMLNVANIGGSPNADSMIKYCEIFGRTTFNVSSLLHNSTSDFNDDIEDLVVLSSIAQSGHTGIDFINNSENYGTTSFLMYGIARQIAYNMAGPLGQSIR